MKTTITLESAIAALQKAVDSKPAGYAYDTARTGADLPPEDRPFEGGELCVYFEGAEPSCIVGQVLHEHGYTADDLVHNGQSLNADTNISTLRGLGLVQIDDATENLLRRAQDHQDKGSPWADSVADAIERAAR